MFIDDHSGFPPETREVIEHIRCEHDCFKLETPNIQFAYLRKDWVIHSTLMMPQRNDMKFD